MALVRWWMGELGSVRVRQIVARRSMFDELSSWKRDCPKEVADYHEWHAYRGLEQQSDWLNNPTTDVAWKHVHEVDRFIQNYNTIRPALSKTSNTTTTTKLCAPCSLIRWLLSEDQRSVINQNQTSVKK